ncbi:MAG: L-threonylcarbamoyladenylate synthase [bacterium]|nr:L-threonylcarbamoyladenylate synthase [bacterium]MDZ4285572.1 L-threonylcarbamoyladenylate synthase [Candidatus Sungbacteria bacterium]
MEVIVLEQNQEQALEKAEAAIRRGKLIAVPTDTVYGIIGDGTDKDVISALYALKERPKEKVFPLFIKDIAMARWFAYISDAKATFLTRVWPGGVSVVFHHKEKLPKNVTAGNNTIALRLPNHPFLLALLARLDIPLVQSSANLSGIPPAMTAEQVLASFEKQKQKPVLLIDGGETPGIPSSIIDLTTNNARLIRGGTMNKKHFDLLVKELSEAGL